MNGFEARELAGQEFIQYINTLSDSELRKLRKELHAKDRAANLGQTPPLPPIEKAQVLVTLRESVSRAARKSLEVYYSNEKRKET